MKLSILISVCNEKPEEVVPLLTSLAAQQRVDWNDIEVVMCNDCGTFDINKIDLSLPFSIHYFENAWNQGVANTRQHLLRAAEGDYVMFCDGDDSFYQVNAIHLILEQIKIGFNVLVSCFFEEVFVPEDNSIIYIPHRQDKVFIHGKVYNHQFLVNNSIYWVDVCPCEDSYFNKLALAVSGEMKYIQDPLYLWKFRGNSIVRHDMFNWEFNNHPYSISVEDKLIDELLSRGLDGNARFEILYQLLQTYFALHSQRWLDRPKDLEKAEKAISKFATKYRLLINEIGYEAIKTMYDQNVESVKETGFIELEPFGQWLERIIK